MPTLAPNPNADRTWRICAASVPGVSHIESGRGSDDAFAYAVAPDGRGVVIAVADGAGSRSGTSALGSFAACRAVMSDASTLLAASSSEQAMESAIRKCFADARAAVESYAGEHGLQVRDLATTLAVAVLTPDAAIAAQVGDGIIVFDLDSGFESLIPEAKGEYANEVVFLTSPREDELDSHVRTQFFPAQVPRIALSTDGLRYKILRLHDAGVPFDPFFTAVWQAVAAGSLNPSSLSDWLLDLDDQTGDDKTLVIGALVDGPLRGSTLPKELASPAPPVRAAAAPGSESTP